MPVSKTKYTRHIRDEFSPLQMATLQLHSLDSLISVLSKVQTSAHSSSDGPSSSFDLLSGGTRSSSLFLIDGFRSLSVSWVLPYLDGVRLPQCSSLDAIRSMSAFWGPIWSFPYFRLLTASLLAMFCGCLSILCGDFLCSTSADFVSDGLAWWALTNLIPTVFPSSFFFEPVWSSREVPKRRA